MINCVSYGTRPILSLPSSELLTAEAHGAGCNPHIMRYSVPILVPLNSSAAAWILWISCSQLWSVKTWSGLLLPVGYPSLSSNSQHLPMMDQSGRERSEPFKYTSLCLSEVVLDRVVHYVWLTLSKGDLNSCMIVVPFWNVRNCRSTIANAIVCQLTTYPCPFSIDVRIDLLLSPRL